MLRFPARSDTATQDVSLMNAQSWLARAPRVIARAVYDLFSSVWFGVSLLVLLFIYASLGSAGWPHHLGGPLFDWDNWLFEPVRQRPGIELTEFEWFHWWPFNLLISGICLTLVVTTLRRIRLDALRLGVWMIHTGIIVLCFGSWLYFGNKVEGLSPVARRVVVARPGDGQEARFAALPNNTTLVGAEGHVYDLRVFDIEKQLPLPPGGQATSAYGVQVMVRGPHVSYPFVRQLIDGHPELTHDLVMAAEELLPASEVLGVRLVDEHLELLLEPFEQSWFYLSNQLETSWALYLREAGTQRWSQRPIEGLSQFHDRVRVPSQVWMPPGEVLPMRPVDLPVPSVEPGDPLGSLPVSVTAFLRYAAMERREVPGDAIFPTCKLLLDSGAGRVDEFELAALDPRRKLANRGFLAMAWAVDHKAWTELGRARPPSLSIRVPDAGVTLEHVIESTALADAELGFTTIEGSDYSFRVEFIQNFDQADMPASVLSVEIVAAGRRFRRWLSEDPGFVRDVEPPQLAAGAVAPGGGLQGLLAGDRVSIDAGIDVIYRPAHVPAPVVVVAGPGDDDLGLVVNLGSAIDGYRHPIVPGELFALGEGIVVSVEDFMARSVTEVRPAVIPRSRRQRAAGSAFSMVLVELDVAGRRHEAWVPFQNFPMQGVGVHLRTRRPLQSGRVLLGDGREIELVLSTRRLPLPSAVVLDDFYITSHEGGFTGSVSSIVDWTSVVSFLHSDGRTPSRPVSVNAPIEDQGLWFFQAQWDSPDSPRFAGDPGSGGLNYTVLGVGNRVGVGIQMLGCCIAVLGMLYAFYFKPVLIKRRLQSARAATEVGS
jgi:hypothetical protein